EAELAGAAAVPAFALGLEHRAAGHLALVDVQGDGDGLVAGIADGVVLVRRDQAAGGAGTGLHGADVAEAEALVLAGDEFVLADLQLALPHAFHAPHAGVVVHGRALAGAPGHCDDAVAVLFAGVELAAGVVAVHGLEHALGQFDVAVADQPAQGAAQGVGDGLVVAAADGAVDGFDELAATGEFEVQHGGKDTSRRRARRGG